jgi:short chain dehydrogenase
MAATPAT